MPKFNEMTLLYALAIHLYHIIINIAALLGHQKAKLWVRGRKNIFENIATTIDKSDKKIWIHASSLGEFEQGRPVIEKLKELKPEYKIVLTFFSPSGYEIRKDYKGADHIFYLPLDTRTNANRFIDLVQPEIAIFIKYEFWHHYINVLKQKSIPLYLISANFRKDQHFFRWYGGWFRKLLFNFKHIFVQNERSLNLLKSIGLNSITVAGDTRFDRVYAIATAAKELPLVKNFVGNSPCLIAGSSWEPDEDLLTSYFNETNHSFKMIFAPHEIKEPGLQSLIQKINKKVIRYSQLKETPDVQADVLIIDNIGMLSSLYRYGNIAYIGGGFGKGIHNILEAATFGMPILFGPHYGKFQEAIDLIKAGGAFPITDYPNLKLTLDTLIENTDKANASGNISRNFVQDNRGATNIIVKELFISTKYEG